MATDPIREAISLIRRGEKEQARALLEPLTTAEPQNERAWMWYLETLPDNRSRMAALERFLAHNPENMTAQRALVRLRTLLADGVARAEADLPAPLAAAEPPATEGDNGEAEDGSNGNFETAVAQDSSIRANITLPNLAIAILLATFILLLAATALALALR